MYTQSSTQGTPNDLDVRMSNNKTTTRGMAENALRCCPRQLRHIMISCDHAAVPLVYRSPHPTSSNDKSSNEISNNVTVAQAQMNRQRPRCKHPRGPRSPPQGPLASPMHVSAHWESQASVPGHRGNGLPDEWLARRVALRRTVPVRRKRRQAGGVGHAACGLSHMPESLTTTCLSVSAW